jgi:DNA-binding NtrC family response regulator
MPLPVQAKLLQVLQDRQFSRLGSRADIKANVRVVAATNKDLGQLVARLEFREDLYYRLNVINLHIPALRERPEEIPILTELLLDYHARAYRRPKPRLSSATRELFAAYSWPGNVRELENVLTRIVVLGTEEWVAAELGGRSQSAQVPASAQARQATAEPAPGAGLREDEDLGLKHVVARAAKEAERAELHRALGRARWRRVEAARRLKISYRTLLRKIEEHGLDRH